MKTTSQAGGWYIEGAPYWPPQPPNMEATRSFTEEILLIMMTDIHMGTQLECHLGRKSAYCQLLWRLGPYADFTRVAHKTPEHEKYTKPLKNKNS